MILICSRALSLKSPAVSVEEELGTFDGDIAGCDGGAVISLFSCFSSLLSKRG